MCSRGPLILQVRINRIATSAFVVAILTWRVGLISDTSNSGVVGIERPISRRALGIGWLSGYSALLVHEVLERVSGKHDITTTWFRSYGNTKISDVAISRLMYLSPTSFVLGVCGGRTPILDGVCAFAVQLLRVVCRVV